MNIAIIDDSELISQMVTNALKPYGYIPDRIKSSQIRDISIENYQMLTVSSSLYNVEQKELVESFRKESLSIPIIAILNKGDWKERISLFESGADDVLNFPFPIKELVVRIENLLRRPKERADKQYNIEDIIINTAEKCARDGEKEIELRRKEYSILEYLAKNQGRTVSRTELMDNIWDYRKITGSNTVDVHISNLRKKLSGKDIIKTVHGFGYKIEKK